MENNKSMIMAVVAILVLVGGGIGVFALTRDSGDDVSSTDSTQVVDDATVQETAPSDIVALASDTSSLSTLVSAVQAADLVSTLQSEGPFTVFAPTNDAFAALPEGTLASLLLPENKAQLSGILTYHVVSGKVLSSQLSNGQVITTVNGQNLTVEIMDGSVMLVDAGGNKATVTAADVEASNGVVHIIDRVVLPQ